MNSRLSDTDQPLDWRDTSFTRTERGHHLEERLVVFGRSAEQWAERLRRFVEETDRLVVRGTARASQPHVAFVFSGQGAQWFAMGRRLLSNPRFSATFDACEAVVKKHAGWSLREEFLRDEGTSRLADTSIAQPSIVCFKYVRSLFTRATESVPPQRWVIDSEVSACFAAGSSSLEDAVRLSIIRGAIMKEATGLGKMAAIPLSEQAVLERLEPGMGISIAAVNAPIGTRRRLVQRTPLSTSSPGS